MLTHIYKIKWKPTGDSFIGGTLNDNASRLGKLFQALRQHHSQIRCLTNSDGF